MKFLLLASFVLFGSCAFSQTQVELNESAHKEYLKKDAELNKVYKKLVAKLGASKDKDLLVKAQRAWIAYRDAHCAYTESSYEGGSMQPLVYSGCMRQVTEERIKQLKEAIEERVSK